MIVSRAIIFKLMPTRLVGTLVDAKTCMALQAEAQAIY